MSAAQISDSRLLTLVGCIHGLVLEFDAEARYVNAWADDVALLARPPAEMIGKTIDEVLGADAGAPFTAAVKRVYATGRVESFEYPIDLATGRHWFFADIKRVGTPAEGMTVVLFARDITERKATEEALARSEERFRLAARATSEAVWDWDVPSGALAWGGASGEVLGWESPGTYIAWWKERIHPDDYERVVVGIQRALGGDASSWSDRYRFRRADEAYADFFDRGFILRDATGTPTRMVGAMADVTLVNRMQAQLAHADRLAALGLLAAGVGHEINNPLTYVVNNVEIALDEVPASSEVARALREAREGAARIADIVKTLKLFSRAEETKLVDIDVTSVLERALKMAENEIRHRARLVRCIGATPLVRATESMLAQVFLNLLVNAAQAMDESAPGTNEVRVTTGVDSQGRVVVSVADTGCGIAPDDVGRIFDPFYTTKPGVGTGLGLSICNDLVRKLGGTMSVESKPGAGSRFTVHLVAATPASTTAGAASGAGTTETAARRGALPRLLVIDDEAPIGRIVQRILKNDAEVIPMTSGRDALERVVRGESFDVVLCDLMMPDLTGMDFFEELRAQRPELASRVVFMTGGAFTPRAREFLAAEQPPFIEKPLERAAVRELVRRRP